jgi:hypothetical protein
MDISYIYLILSSKPHNSHYLKRYIKFIENCYIKNYTSNEPLERHHICPKAKDMFFEYENLNLYEWNMVMLTKKQHFIAHLLLWKSYPTFKSTMFALWLMSNRTGNKLFSKTYEMVKEEYTEYKYKSILPKGMTRSEFNDMIEQKKLHEKELKLSKKAELKQKKLHEKEKQKELRKYNQDNDLLSCIICRRTVNNRQYKWHYSISYGNCTEIKTKKYTIDDEDGWHSPKSLRKK